MKNLIKTRFGISIIVLSIIAFISCTKTEDENIDDINIDLNTNYTEEVQAAEDNATAENLSNEVFNIIDDASKSSNNSLNNYKKLDGTDSIKITKEDHLISIDFGNGYLTKKGRLIAGKISASYNGKYLDSLAGYNCYITFENFSIDNNSIKGFKSINGKGLINGNLTYELSAVDTITLANNEGTITWNTERVRTWTKGANTPINWLDDEYSITGSSSGISKDNKAYNVDVVTPLIIKTECKYITQGSLKLTVSGKKPITIDYGSGDCDDKATVTVLGQEVEITMGY
ncbi:MAG: hypothetical protein A2X12_09025 [Bacteroidetes bacterium GWE2_29_8]|nr:MAG: hypothetical protein A2X12_09025 [Bacteroidetes bacterium GWE2_29_8]OFY22895.1 MAG: hypothetical protein A2X02_08970 [Bacteroidetes bacterium GWF2_29_10]